MPCVFPGGCPSACRNTPSLFQQVLSQPLPNALIDTNGLCRTCQHTVGHHADSEAPSTLVSPHMLNFVRELSNAHIYTPAGAYDVPRHGGMIMQLPNGAFILGKQSLGSKMYLRKHWEPLYQEIKTQLENANKKGILVLGTPGIGKSQFVCYLLYRLREDYVNSEILFVDHKRAVPEQSTYISAKAQALNVEPVDNNPSIKHRVFANSNNFAIFDQGGGSCAPTGYSCRAIVISSLDSHHYKDFLAEYSLYVVDTTWSREEIDEAYEFVFSHNEKLVDYAERYLQVGGLPRWVFDTNLTAQQAIASFISNMPDAKAVEDLLRAQSIRSIRVNQGARLVTHEIDAHFKEKEMRWVSDRVGQMAMQTMMDGTDDHAARILFEISKSHDRTSYGCAFEAWAHIKLAAGGTFKVRALHDPNQLIKSSTIELKQSETTWYDGEKGEETHVKNKHYGRPTSRSAESIDSIYQPDMMFQITVSDTKKINVDALATITARMKGPNTKLIIVVPDVAFHSFKQCHYVNADGVATQLPHGIQAVFVLSLPMARARKRPRAQLEKDTRQVLRDQAIPHAVVYQLVVSARTEEELETLEATGLTVMKKKGPVKSWAHINDFPTGQGVATHSIYKRSQKSTFDFVCVPITIKKQK